VLRSIGRRWGEARFAAAFGQPDFGRGYEAEGVAERAEDAAEVGAGLDQFAHFGCHEQEAQEFGGAGGGIGVVRRAGEDAAQPVEWAGQGIGYAWARWRGARRALARGVGRVFDEQAAEPVDPRPGEADDCGGLAAVMGLARFDIKLRLYEVADPEGEPGETVGEGFSVGSHGGIGPHTQGGEKGGLRRSMNFLRLRGGAQKFVS